GYFSPPLWLRRIRGDINISPLGIRLQLSHQPVGKKYLCIDIFHAGSLLAILARRQSQHQICGGSYSMQAPQSAGFAWRCTWLRFFIESTTSFCSAFDFYLPCVCERA